MKFIKRQLSYLDIQRLSLLPYKSRAVSLLFTLFFGPVGLLYASMWGGVITSFAAIAVFGSALPGPIIFFWLMCNIFGVMSVQWYNDKIIMAKLRLNNEKNNIAT